jgi:uncharacterized membrane protein YphA (DoxX/SURF4 family)
LGTVQRLFSIFPTGTAGFALVVLRSVVAITVIVETHSLPAMGLAHTLDALVGLVGLFLFLGLLTPYCAALCCLLELAFLVVNGIPNGFQLGMSALTAASMAALGPGAYSLDARLFGRKLIKIPPRRNS